MFLSFFNLPSNLPVQWYIMTSSSQAFQSNLTRQQTCRYCILLLLVKQLRFRRYIFILFFFISYLFINFYTQSEILWEKNFNYYFYQLKNLPLYEIGAVIEIIIIKIFFWTSGEAKFDFSTKLLDRPHYELKRFI